MKKISIQLIGFMCLVLVVSCSKTNFEKTDDGVKIALNKSTTGGIQNLKLNVISENTIQVLASATDSFSIRKSLSIIEQTGDPVDFNVAHSANTITISTSNLTAMVNVKNGTIASFR